MVLLFDYDIAFLVCLIKSLPPMFGSAEQSADHCPHRNLRCLVWRTHTGKSIPSSVLYRRYHCQACLVINRWLYDRWDNERRGVVSKVCCGCRLRCYFDIGKFLLYYLVWDRAGCSVCAFVYYGVCWGELKYFLLIQHLLQVLITVIAIFFKIYKFIMQICAYFHCIII